MLPSKGYSVLLILYQLFAKVPANVVDVTSDNIHQLLESYDLVVLNFYVPWCKFSIQLEPILNVVEQHIRHIYADNKHILVGRVNCDNEPALAKQYWISKYPTLAVVQHGIIKWNEYHGPRTVSAIITFLDTHMRDPVRELQAHDKFNNSIHPKSLVVGYFKSESVREYSVYRQAVRYLGPFGQFYVGVGDIAKEHYPDGRSVIVFSGTNGEHIEYTGNMNNIDDMRKWIFYRFQPMVLEITFANAEILTQTTLPLLILFHKKDDYKSLKLYREAVEAEATTDSNYYMAANFVTANFEMFSEVIAHVGKTEKDLPLIAADTFEHMYVFPNFEDISIPGKLQQFIDDLHSGKLHHEFHQKAKKEVLDEIKKVTTQIPMSKFKDLKPSKHRYTLVKDEL